MLVNVLALLHRHVTVVCCALAIPAFLVFASKGLKKNYL
jgi:hypothetical protein